jgi:hypothetical protein
LEKTITGKPAANGLHQRRPGACIKAALDAFEKRLADTNADVT